MNLLLFVAAMSGPNVGCTVYQFSSVFCTQSPGEPALVCDDHRAPDRWSCEDYRPAGLYFDFDGDLDVDLRDFAELQNRGMR